MSNINNQTNNLYTIDTVQDLSQESAAAIQGGILVWSGPNFTGVRRDLQASSNLAGQGFDNQISSITNNTQKTWAFYTSPNFGGSVFRLDPGMRLSALGIRDNQISSMRSL